ncbi:unnamed protein product, partial [Musa acuminata var. zebrina]
GDQEPPWRQSSPPFDSWHSADEGIGSPLESWKRSTHDPYSVMLPRPAASHDASVSG